MPDQFINTTVEGRTLRLSNPCKILYPTIQVTKGGVISYLVEYSDVLLPLIKGRPLTLIRFPDGVDGKHFYSKNKPTWTPSWIGSTFFPGDKENQYLLAHDKASLAWIGNLAALEIHPMNVRKGCLTHPDQFIFDLDPSEEINFDELKEIAHQLRLFLESYEYTPFIKTSGGKGLHIYVPLHPKYSIDAVFDSVKKLAITFVSKFSKTTTLRIKKEKRKGRVLLDIYRNHKAQSCVAPFSLRGKPGAPVSMPFPWTLLEKVENSQQWNIKNIGAFLRENGNAWENYTQRSSQLHDQSTIYPVK